MKKEAVKGKKKDVKIQNTWRVLDDEGKNQGSMEVHHHETVNWHAKKSSIEFRFPEEVDIDKYFEYEEGTFKDGRTQKVKKGKKLWLTVKEGAPEAEIEYDIEVLDTGEMVVGNSRPKLIVRG